MSLKDSPRPSWLVKLERRMGTETMEVQSKFEMALLFLHHSTQRLKNQTPYHYQWHCFFFRVFCGSFAQHRAYEAGVWQTVAGEELREWTCLRGRVESEEWNWVHAARRGNVQDNSFRPGMKHGTQQRFVVCANQLIFMHFLLASELSD